MSGSEDSFGWCSDHSIRVEMSDDDGNDFMTHPEVNSHIVKKEKIEQYLSLEENIFQSTATEKRKKKVKSVVATTYDAEVQDVDNSIYNELFPKKKNKKKIKDAGRNLTDLNEDKIKVEKENNDRNTSKRLEIDYLENDVRFNVTNEEPSKKKKKKQAEIPVPEDEIHLSSSGIKSEFSLKKKKKKHQGKEQTTHHSNFTEKLNTTSMKKSKKKNIEEIDEAEITADRAINLLRKHSFHYESSDSNDKKYINSQHQSIENHLEDVQSVVGSTPIKQESNKKKKKNRKSKIENTHEPSDDQSECTDNGTDVERKKTERIIKRERNNSTSSDTSDSLKQQVRKNYKSPITHNTKIDETKLGNGKNGNKNTNKNNNDNSSDEESSHDTPKGTSDAKSRERRKSVGERMQSEDDDIESAQMSDHESINSKYNHDNKNKFSKVLENFKTLKIDKQLFDQKLQINPSHDLFLLKFPRNLDINQLLGTSMAMDGKSKFKIENKIYECIFENNEKQYRTIMSPSKKSGEYRLQSIMTQGEMRLRRKLPKPNVANHMAALKPNTFMQLPETKRRHPLFGIEYKPMIKINKRVAERLQEAQTIASPAIIKKKKKVKPELTDLDISIKKNKKRKRKGSDSESIPEVAPKKLKRDPEKPEKIWGSEKQIAQSLFAGL